MTTQPRPRALRQPRGVATVVLVTLLGLAGVPVPAAAQPKTPKALFVSTPQNTLHYNHQTMTWKDDAASCAKAEPPKRMVVPVLRIADGDPFVIEFCRTDPRAFRYTISAIEEKEGEFSSTLETTAPVRTTVEKLTSVQVVFRHNKVFRRYRVTATAVTGTPVTEAEKVTLGVEENRRFIPSSEAKLEGTPVVLYGVAFDVLVDTKPGWELTVSGGMAFSNLTSRRFYVKTDTKGTTDANDDTQTVEEDPNETDSFRPDIIALANIQPPTLNWTRALGLAFGLGIGDNSDARYFLGPSYTVGKHFIFTAGWTGGRVDTLPAGQQLGSAPINGANTLTTLGKRFRHGFYAGIAFTFIDRTEAFTGGFEGSTTVKPDPKKEEGKEGTEDGGKEKPGEKPKEKAGEKKPGGGLEN